MISTESGLQYTDIDITDGPEVRKGQKVRLNYRLAFSLESLNRDDDTGIIDSSDRHKSPVIVTVGSEEAIPGLDEALVGMRRGATRRVIIPADLAFGARGIPHIVPPNTTLYIDVNVSTKL